MRNVGRISLAVRLNVVDARGVTSLRTSLFSGGDLIITSGLVSPLPACLNMSMRFLNPGDNFSVVARASRRAALTVFVPPLFPGSPQKAHRHSRKHHLVECAPCGRGRSRRKLERRHEWRPGTHECARHKRTPGWGFHRYWCGNSARPEHETKILDGRRFEWLRGFGGGHPFQDLRQGCLRGADSRFDHLPRGLTRAPS